MFYLFPLFSLFPFIYFPFSLPNSSAKPCTSWKLCSKTCISKPFNVLHNPEINFVPQSTDKFFYCNALFVQSMQLWNFILCIERVKINLYSIYYILYLYIEIYLYSTSYDEIWFAWMPSYLIFPRFFQPNISQKIMKTHKFVSYEIND